MKWIDLHIDTLMFMVDDGTDPLSGVPEHHVDLPRMRAAEVSCAVWAAWVKEEFSGNEATASAIEMIKAGLLMLDRADGSLERITTRGEFDRNEAIDTPGLIFGIEGACPLQESLELLELFFRLGVRVITLTWNHDNHFGAGCRLDAGEDPGLTKAGVELIQKMDQLGILLDLAHASPRTLEAATGCSQKPFLVSHANCRKLCDHRRNLMDSQMRMVADAGGLLGISVCPHFLSDSPEMANLETVADHIEYAWDLMGVDAVSFGSDFDGITKLPVGLRGVEDLDKIVVTLRTRGHSDDKIEKFAWRNAAAVLRAGLPVE